MANTDQTTGSQCSSSNSAPSMLASTDSGSRHYLLRLLNRHQYNCPETEGLYRSFSYPIEYSCLRSLVILMITLDVSISIVNFVFVSRLSMENISNIVLCFLFVIFLIFIHTRFMSERHLSSLSLVLVLVCLCFAAVSFPIDYQNRTNRKQTPAEGVWRLSYVIFIIYVFIPLRIYVPLIVGFLLPVAHSLTSVFIAGSTTSSTLLWRQITANIIIFLTVNIVGVFIYDRKEKLRRRLFDSITLSISEQLYIQDNNDKMERLLLSFLPQFVADEMKADLRSPHLREIFPKAYIQRHDCVSIIFADVVGLLSLSSHCSPNELIRLFNELFGRFDQLATENHCVRIQLLGDCYYGVCGLPDPRPDHATCCVEMGLDMIDVISFIRDSTELNIEMRVGINTGRILSGVVGHRRWKYDVWSEEVQLAHHTQQASLPGRILVTQATLDHLQGEFPTEVGRGEERSAQLKNKAVKTFLIVAEHHKTRYGPIAKHSMSQQRPQQQHGRLSIKNVDGLISGIKFNVDIPFSNVFLNKGRNYLRELAQPSPKRNEDEIYSNRLQKNLSQAINNKTMERTKQEMISYITLCFKSSSKEIKFQRQEDISFPTTILCSLVLLVLSMAVQAVILPRTLLLLVLFVFSFTWISIILIIILGYKIKCVQSDIRKQPKIRQMFSFVTIILVFALSLVNVLCCRRGLLFPGDGHVLSMHAMMIAFNSDHLLECEVPHYIYLNVIITLLVVCLFLRISAMVKLVISSVICAVYIVVIEYMNRSLFRQINIKLSPEVPSDASGILMLLHFTTLLYVMSRHLEWILRLQFLWNQQVGRQRQELRDMEEANHRLILNILPDHVASYFQDIGNEVITEIYSKSHNSVAVSFLTVINLSDLYSLLDGPNRVECLRVLNEIVTAIDKLMDNDRYKSVDKIKTFGTTYMSAVGLREVCNKPDETEDLKNRQQLIVLIEFIFEAMEIVTQRNANLMLRAGIDIGPVMAGVVGSRKPQYDIWGDTVNVANQLERTGLPHCIQVAENVHEQLKTKYQFHCRGPFKISGKPNNMAYLLTARMTTKGFGENQSDLLQKSNINGMFPMTNPSKQPESSYEFTSNSSVISVKEDEQEWNRVLEVKNSPQSPPALETKCSPRSPPALEVKMTPPALQAKDINSLHGAGRHSLTPPNSIGRKRSSVDGCINEPYKKSNNRQILPNLGQLLVNSSPDDREKSSPDLPLFHYRNAAGQIHERPENTLTQAQLLNREECHVQQQQQQQLHRISDSPKIASSQTNASPPISASSNSRLKSDLLRKNPSVDSNTSPSCERMSQLYETNRNHGGISTSTPPFAITNNQRPRDFIINQSETQQQQQRQQRQQQQQQLSRLELDDIDLIMKEFMTDFERKQQQQHPNYDANRWDDNNSKLKQPINHERRQQNNNICRRSTSLVTSKMNQPIKVINQPNNYYDEDFVAMNLEPVNARGGALQPPAEAKVLAQVKNAPRVSLVRQQQYPVDEKRLQEILLRKEMPPLEKCLISSKMAVLVRSSGQDQSIDRKSPSPLPHPLPLNSSVSISRAAIGVTSTHPPPPPSSTTRPQLTNNVQSSFSVPPAQNSVKFRYAPVLPSSTHHHHQHQHPHNFRPATALQSSKKSHKGFVVGGNHQPYRSSVAGQTKRLHVHGFMPAPPPPAPLRNVRSMENISSDPEEGMTFSRSTSPSSRHDGCKWSVPPSRGGAFYNRGQGLLMPPADNISLSSSFSGSEMSRSDPTLSYDSANSTVESEYDNYRPGMASDEDYFVIEPISDIDIDLFDDIDIDNVQIPSDNNNYNYSYHLPILQTMTDV